MIILVSMFGVFLGETLGALCKWLGPRVYLEVRDVVLQTIRDNLTRDFEHLRVSEGEASKLASTLSSTPETSSVEMARPVGDHCCLVK